MLLTGLTSVLATGGTFSFAPLLLILLLAVVGLLGTLWIVRRRRRKLD